MKKFVKLLHNTFSIQTANGLTSINKQLNYSIPWLNQMRFEPMILPNTAPAVMSLGKKIEEGWSFIWKPAGAPYLITPNGKHIEMTVIQRVPYLLNPKSLDITAMPAINEAQIGPAIGESSCEDRNIDDKMVSPIAEATADALHAPAGYVRAVMTADPVPNPPKPSATPGGAQP